MQIQSIQGFRLLLTNTSNKNNSSSNNFGLRMAEPLKHDTVSFGCLKQTKKALGDPTGRAPISLIKQVRAIMKKPHEKNKQTFLDYFGEFLTPKSQEKYLGEVRYNNPEKYLFTMDDRIKRETSIQEKTGTDQDENAPVSRTWTKEALINEIRDISGFCFILENKKSFKEFEKIFSKMIRQGNANPIEVEYHSKAPKRQKGKVVESYDSLDLDIIDKIKNTINDVINPTKDFFYARESRSGYSAMHITLKNPDGTYSEIQVPIRGVYEVKEKAENASYKKRNGKTLEPQYVLTKQVLAPLEKKPAKMLSPEELAAQNALQKAMTEYTQEVYCDAIINHPYDRDFEFLEPENPLIKPFSFNNIRRIRQIDEDNYAREKAKESEGSKAKVKNKSKKSKTKVKP